jgi:hypothetical protein
MPRQRLQLLCFFGYNASQCSILKDWSVLNPNRRHFIWALVAADITDAVRCLAVGAADKVTGFSAASLKNELNAVDAAWHAKTDEVYDTSQDAGFIMLAPSLAS